MAKRMTKSQRRSRARKAANTHLRDAQASLALAVQQMELAENTYAKSSMKVRGLWRESIGAATAAAEITEGLLEERL